MNKPEFETLIDLLSHQAKYVPTNPAVQFGNQSIAYQDLWEGIRIFGANLLQLGLQSGDRVLLVLPNSIEFFYAFYGSQVAGGIAVPIFPNSGEKRVLNFAKLCGAKYIVLPTGLPIKLLSKFKSKANQQSLKLISVSEGLTPVPANSKNNFPGVQTNDISFLQYTSGSTGNPKGVILTHENLLTNIEQMIAGMEITKEDIFVSWLPVYHDMGLILKTMVPFYLGIKTTLLPTNLADIRPWFDTIQRIGGTFTAAPDFAYRLSLRHIKPSDYNLKSLRVALNAAEPVRSTTLNEFQQAFGLSNVMVAGYGLAEATVGVSMWKPGTKNRIDDRGFVSVGKPFPQIDIKIIENEEELPRGEIGEIQIKSPANASGYFLNPDATKETFSASGYMKSGDLGYLDKDGYLYIVSRRKNIIKRSGETIAPQEIEELVDQLPDVRYSAVIGVDRGDLEGEQVIVFTEIRNPNQKSETFLHQTIINLVAEIHRQFGFRPARTFLLHPKSIPLTHNGKIQHQNLKFIYLDGSLRASGAIIYPEY
ncbi:MAG: AMP-binding protein [Anaerolineales bacterium]